MSSTVTLLTLVDTEDGQVVAQYEVMHDDGTREVVVGAVYPSRELATAIFVDCGWSASSVSVNALYPPSSPPYALLGVPTATASFGIPGGSTELTEEERRSGVWPRVHLTKHSSFGRCFGFSFVAGYPTDPDSAVDVTMAAMQHAYDPVLDLITGTLIKIECVGHWLTRTSALQAARDFYHHAREVVGGDALDSIVEIFIRKEEHERRARQQAGSE